jgi:hypothetical protein
MSNATLTFGVVGPTMDFTTSVNVSEANSQRILAYLTNGSHYGTVTEDDGTERQATAEEAAQAFALGILQGLLDQTVRYEKDEAAKAAAEAVAPIDMG